MHGKKRENCTSLTSDGKISALCFQKMWPRDFFVNLFYRWYYLTMLLCRVGNIAIRKNRCAALSLFYFFVLKNEILRKCSGALTTFQAFKTMPSIILFTDAIDVHVSKRKSWCFWCFTSFQNPTYVFWSFQNFLYHNIRTYIILCFRGPFKSEKEISAPEYNKLGFFRYLNSRRETNKLKAVLNIRRHTLCKFIAKICGNCLKTTNVEQSIGSWLLQDIWVESFSYQEEISVTAHWL